MQFKIGVSGSSSGQFSQELQEKTRAVGREIAHNKCILLSGAGLGLPYEAVKSAKVDGGFTIGFSPALNLFEHTKNYRFPTEFFDVLLFTGFGLKGRNLLFVRSCDAIILVSGKMGTLNEFTIAYDEGKYIGILSDSGGISEEIKKILSVTSKPTKSKIIYHSNPSSLVKKLIFSIKKENMKKYRYSD